MVAILKVRCSMSSRSFSKYITILSYKFNYNVVSWIHRWVKPCSNQDLHHEMHCQLQYVANKTFILFSMVYMLLNNVFTFSPQFRLYHILYLQNPCTFDSIESYSTYYFDSRCTHHIILYDLAHDYHIFIEYMTSHEFTWFCKTHHCVKLLIFHKS